MDSLLGEKLWLAFINKLKVLDTEAMNKNIGLWKDKNYQATCLALNLMYKKKLIIGLVTEKAEVT